MNAPREVRALDKSASDLRAENVSVVTRVSIPAMDGYVLGGVLHEPAGSTTPPCAVVINCGGGIPADRYTRFAQFLASRGIPTLTYDYRGIGASRPARLRGFVATVEDWGDLDCSGAIAWLRTRYPQVELVGLAHSVGAMLLGAATNSSELSRLAFIGAHTGYFGDYRPLYRAPMAVLWHAVMPMLAHGLGYFPGRVLRLGENIPAGVALQWASRRSPDLRSKSKGPGRERTELLLSRYAEIHAPVYALSFTDDAFATEKGTRRLLSMYPAATARHDVLDPASVGLGEIGHFGFFRRVNGPTLWPILMPFLLSSSDAGQSTADRSP